MSVPSGVAVGVEEVSGLTCADTELGGIGGVGAGGRRCPRVVGRGGGVEGTAVPRAAGVHARQRDGGYGYSGVGAPVGDEQRVHASHDLQPRCDVVECEAHRTGVGVEVLHQACLGGVDEVGATGAVESGDGEMVVVSLHVGVAVGGENRSHLVGVGCAGRIGRGKSSERVEALVLPVGHVLVAVGIVPCVGILADGDEIGGRGRLAG